MIAVWPHAAGPTAARPNADLLIAGWPIAGWPIAVSSAEERQASLDLWGSPDRVALAARAIAIARLDYWHSLP
jgi:hypothetical protein